MLLEEKLDKCTGCGACINKCKNNCIKIVQNIEGFIEPQIDKEYCKKCKNCEKVCPILNNYTSDNREHPDFYVAYSKDDSIALSSSSGGVFWHIVEYFINNNGIVYGAVLTDNFMVRHYRGSTLEECKKMRKSKYLQSDIGMIFRNVEEDLINNNKVLFSGTPCQITGLYSFLGKKYENLFTIDLVCHGVPSKRVFDMYMETLTDNCHEPISICWRDKRDGWRPNKVSVQFSDGYELCTTSMDSPIQKGFLKNLFLRKSCYSCKFSKLPRVGDVSLGDFWGYTGDLVSENRNVGLSMVIVSNEKGKYIFDVVKELLNWQMVDEESAKSRARHVYTHPEYNELRTQFMNDVINGEDFMEIKKKYIDN